MKRTIKILALLLAVLMVFTACGKKESGESGNSGSSSGSSSSDGIFDFSSSFDDNGYWKGVKASELVTLADDYKDYKVDEATVDTTIQYYLSVYPNTKELHEGVVKDGDSVNIDYVGYIDGTAFDGGNTQGQGTTVTIGVTSYIDDFLEQLIGHSVGDSFDINVTFPDEYPNNPDLAGKDAVFKTTVNYIVEYEDAELTDDFVLNNLSSTYGWQTVSEMRDGIIQNLAMDNAYTTAQFGETPQVMKDFIYEEIVSEVEYYYSYFEQLAEQYNVDVNTVLYTTMGYETKEDYLAGALEGYEEQARFYLFYQALAEDLGITASEKDVAAKVASIATEDVSYEDLISYYGMNFMKWQVVVENTVNKLGEMAKP